MALPHVLGEPPRRSGFVQSVMCPGGPRANPPGRKVARLALDFQNNRPLPAGPRASPLRAGASPGRRHGHGRRFYSKAGRGATVRQGHVTGSLAGLRHAPDRIEGHSFHGPTESSCPNSCTRNALDRGGAGRRRKDRIHPRQNCSPRQSGRDGSAHFVRHHAARLGADIVNNTRPLILHVESPIRHQRSAGLAQEEEAAVFVPEVRSCTSGV